MFINKVSIKNYRLFANFEIPVGRLGIPDGKQEGSGLTLILGENGRGKTSILDAISLGLATYTTESFELADIGDVSKDLTITIEADKVFSVKKTISGDFTCTGLIFKANAKKVISRKYLNKLVTSDNLFIPEDTSAFKSTSSDLRVSVNNPFSGPRFDDNDYLIIDKNRTNQIRKGRYSPTRFDRLLEDYNLKYLSLKEEKPDLNKAVDTEFNRIASADNTLEKAFDHFNELTEYSIDLYHIDAQQPFKNSFVAHSTGNKSTPLIMPERLGSGYHMFLALLCQYYMSIETEKDLIVLIDEAELHLHPSLQKQLIELILVLSKKAQVLITSHSTELVKQLSRNKHHKSIILDGGKEEPAIEPLKEFVLPLPTAAETNYIAFNTTTLEYHNELYGHVMELLNDTTVAGLDSHLGVKNEDKYDWYNESTKSTQKLSAHSVIRNYFHHPNGKNNSFCNTTFINDNLSESIDFLRRKIKEASAR